MIEVYKGSTSRSTWFVLVDSTTGQPKPGVAYTAVTASYARTRSARVAITTASLAAATTAWTSGGWFEQDAANQPGLYRFDIPDEVFAAGVEEVVVSVVATGCRAEHKGFILTDWNKQVASIPPVAAAAVGGLLTAPVTANTGLANITQILGNPASVATSMLLDMTQTLPASPTADTVGEALKFADTRLDAATTTRASQASVDALATYVDTEVAAIKLKTDALPADPADASDIAASFTAVNTTLTTLSGYVDTEVGAIKTTTDKLATALEVDGSNWRFTDDALVNAPAGGGGSLGGTVDANVVSVNGAAISMATSASIADAVWDEAQVDHTTAGTFGEYLDAPVSAGGGGGGTADWTAAEQNQLRYRLGIDGTTAVPATGVPHLEIVDANVVTFDGSVYTPGASVTLDMTQIVPTSPTADTTGAALRAAVVAAAASGSDVTVGGFAAGVVPANFNILSIDGAGAVTVAGIGGGTVDANVISVNGTAISMATAGSIADAVWDEAQTDHVLTGSFGEYLDSPISGVSGGGGGASAAAIADAVWDELQAGHTIAGSFGEYVDAQISAGGSGGATDWTVAEQNQLRYRLGIDGTTAVPATGVLHLGTVDANVVTFDGADYTPVSNITIDMAQAIPASPTTNTTGAALRASIDTLASMGSLSDEVIVAGFSPGVAPANFSALDITPTGEVTLAGSGGGTIDANVVSVNGTAVSMATSASIADAVWDETQTDHVLTGSFGEYLDSAVSGVSTGGLSAGAIADAVWDELQTGHTLAGSFGKYVDAQISAGGGGGASAATIAAAVWNEPQAGHTTAGTFGKYVDTQLSTISGGGASAATIAAAVWNEPQAGHTTAGTFGQYVDAQISTISGGGGTADWTAAERNQLRYRWGIDGTSAVPATGVPHLGTVDANVVTFDGADYTPVSNISIDMAQAIPASPAASTTGAALRAAINVDAAFAGAGDEVIVAGFVPGILPPNFNVLNINFGGEVAIDTTGDLINANVVSVDGTPISMATADSIADAVWDEAQAGHAATGTFGKYVDAIKVVTDKLGTAVETSGPNWRFTVDALFNAPAGGGGGAADWSATEKSQIRHRLGIDGTATVPSAGVLHLGTVDANVITFGGETYIPNTSVTIDMAQVVPASPVADTAGAALRSAITGGGGGGGGEVIVAGFNPGLIPENFVNLVINANGEVAVDTRTDPHGVVAGSSPNTITLPAGGRPTGDLLDRTVKLSNGDARFVVAYSPSTGIVTVHRPWVAAIVPGTTRYEIAAAGATVTFDAGVAVAGGTATAFTATSSLLTPTSGAYSGAIVKFQTGVLTGQRRQVLTHTYGGGTHTFTFAAGFTAAPAADRFVVG